MRLSKGERSYVDDVELSVEAIVKNTARQQGRAVQTPKPNVKTGRKHHRSLQSQSLLQVKWALRLAPSVGAFRTWDQTRGAH